VTSDETEPNNQRYSLHEQLLNNIRGRIGSAVGDRLLVSEI